MESRDYEKILNAMPETGIYVIRESDRSVLYVNRRAREVCSNIRLGAPASGSGAAPAAAAPC